MKETTTLYKKVGKRYFKHDNYLKDVGLPQGLYLFYKTSDAEEVNGMMSMLDYVKVHDIKNVNKFCDLFLAHKELVAEAVEKALRIGGFSIKDLTIKIINELANIKD